MQQIHDSLISKGYKQILRMEHAEMLPHLREWMRIKSPYNTAYRIILIASAALVVWQYVFYEFETAKAVSWFFNSFLIAFLLVPMHEYLHIWAYQRMGAIHTSYDVHWRKLMFVALADGFIANYKQFRFIALTPAVVINGILLLLPLVLPPFYGFVASSVAMWHYSMCAGDFGLLSFMYSKRNEDILTFDIVSEKASYFYERNRQ